MAQGRVDNFQPSILRKLMAERSMSASQLAVLLGLTSAAVRRWLNGTSGPSTVNVHRMAEALNVDVLRLLGKTMEDADIVDLRHSVGLSAAEVARRLEVTRGAIYHVEAGIEIPSKRMLDRLASTYKQPRPFTRLAWLRRRHELFGIQGVRNLPDYLDKEVPSEWKDLLDLLSSSEVKSFDSGRIMAYLDAGKIGVAYEIWETQDAATLVEYFDEALGLLPDTDLDARTWRVKNAVMEYFPDNPEQIMLNDQPFSLTELRSLRQELQAAINAVESHLSKTHGQ